jgi:hypothetical protein
MKAGVGSECAAASPSHSACGSKWVAGLAASVACLLPGFCLQQMGAVSQWCFLSEGLTRAEVRSGGWA